MRLRIMTFNIRSGWALDGWNIWPLRRAATAAVIRNHDPDVVAVQEAHRFQLRYLARRFPHYEAVGAGRDDGRQGGEHCTVFVRRACFRIEGHWTRWMSDTPQEPGSRSWGNIQPRIATAVGLLGPEGPLVVCNTHWDERSQLARMLSAAACVTWAKEDGGRPWIVVGDLNATTENPAVQHLLHSGWQDAAAGLPARGTGAATSHGYTHRLDGARIDHILVPEGWRAEAALIARERPRGRYPSDHWPVVATVASC